MFLTIALGGNLRNRTGAAGPSMAGAFVRVSSIARHWLRLETGTHDRSQHHWYGSEFLTISTEHAHDLGAHYLQGEIRQFRRYHPNGVMVSIGSRRTDYSRYRVDR
jgi:hypothetical protein